MPISAGATPSVVTVGSADEVLHDIFAESVARHRSGVAVRLAGLDPEASDHAFLTYGELDDKANRFAHHLVDRGIGRGDRVVVRLPRSLDQYWCVIGILRAGAAYVPVDWNAPPLRIADIVADCRARAIVTRGDVRALDLAANLIIDLDHALFPQSGTASNTPPPATPTASPDDLAYIIYTSGSTGGPKGVMIRHRNACHFVRAESAVLGVTAADRVYGGFSLAFDMSVETMWTGWFAGAEVICASESLAVAGPDVAEVLTRLAVSIWHVAPTLLSIVETDVPSLRLINLGGEVCPAALVERWWTPRRRILNTYGPTETTVTATWAELSPDEPVTIGRPLPGYRALIVDPSMRPVRSGDAGELVIGGPGVGAGYVNRPELTAEKFVTAVFSPGDGIGERAYRTGDLCRLDGNGNIEFLGRIDTQIKIRGYRVELGEIENAILRSDAVAQAVVDLQRDDQGYEQLVAFVVPRARAHLDVDRIRADVHARLPGYMRPQRFEVRRSLPTLVSGKVDRRALARSSAAPRGKAIAHPASPTEARLLDVWRTVFARQDVSVLDNFFDELGGHSLLAARMVSQARSQPALAAISIQDIYRDQTIRSLAERLDQAKQRQTPAAEEIPASASRRRRTLCVAAQAASIVVVNAIAGLEWVLPYLVFFWIAPAHGALLGLTIASGCFVAIPPITLVLFIALKWIVIGHVKPGDYPLWGAYYFRWWLTRRLLAVAPVRYLVGTPLLNLYFRLLGAKVGRGAFLGAEYIDAPDLVTIGEDAIVNQGALLSTSRVERGLLRIGTVSIGRSARVGVRAVVERNASIGDRAVLDDLSALPAGASIPPDEHWTGSPARADGPCARGDTSASVAQKRLVVTVGLSVAAFLLPLAGFLPIAPGLAAIVAADIDGWAYVAVTPVLALSYVVNMCLLSAAAKWALLGRVKAGLYPIWSGFYIRYWFVERVNHLALDLVYPIFATLFVAPWYRLMGAKVAARAEISSASTSAHDLIEFGEECFIADGVSFGSASMQAGGLHLAKTRVGRRAFIGNSALLPIGSDIAEDVLIGVMSRPPHEPKLSCQEGATWFGSPPLRLPNRPSSEAFDETVLFKPSMRLVATRLAIEFVRVVAPLTVVLTLFEAMLLTLTSVVSQTDGFAWLTIAFPLCYLVFNLAGGAFVVALKWLVVGRYRPMTAPHWSLFVWRTELVTSTYEALAAAFLLEPLRGTPFINMYLRLLGCRIGDRVYTDTTDITEFDLVQVGNDAALNRDCGLQTHLFEDRVMKLGVIAIGAGATVGTQSVVLYDSVLEDGAQLGELSVVMKGERLPTKTAWAGSPAQALLN